MTKKPPSIWIRLIQTIYFLWMAMAFSSGLLLFFIPMVIPPMIHKLKGGAISFFFIRIWSWWFSIWSGIWFKVLHKSRAKEQQVAIFVCNHGSFLDSPALAQAIPGQFRPLGKIEMTRYPVFGLLYKQVVVMVDRSSTESRKASILQLKRFLNQWVSVVIFPEGKMNRGKEYLTPFYDGAFRIAIDTQTCIVPMVISGAKELMPRDVPFTAKPGVVKVAFCEPVPPEHQAFAEVASLKAEVYQRMETMLRQISS
jgi:1-acyl-sn-glycerol-3-phosphate acyltransferase